jgi:hypothetical protein
VPQAVGLFFVVLGRHFQEMNIWDRTPSSCDGSSAEVEQPRKNNEDWQKQCADGTKIQGNTSALASQIVNVGLKQRTRTNQPAWCTGSRFPD